MPGHMTEGSAQAGGGVFGRAILGAIAVTGMVSSVVTGGTVQVDPWFLRT